MGDLMEVPIWRLTPDEIESLPKREQQWARHALGEMRADGTLAMLLANPPETKYETVYDGRWCLRPIVETAEQKIEARLAALEKDSHPPIDLEPALKKIFADWEAQARAALPSPLEGR